MKTVLISVADVMTNDLHNEYKFDYFFLIRQTIGDYERLSDYDKKRVKCIFVTEYRITLPDDYDVPTAAQLVRDLFNGDVECPEFDDWFLDASIVRQCTVVSGG